MPQFNTQSCLNFGKSFKAAQSWGRNVFWDCEGLQNFPYLRQPSAEKTTPCHAGVMQGNTFMQMWHWINQGRYCPDPLLTSKEELAGDVLINGNCGCNDYVIAGFMIPRGLIRARNLAGFSLLRELVDWILWQATPKGKGAQEGWQVNLLQTEKLCIPILRKIRFTRSLAWLNWELTAELQRGHIQEVEAG